MHTELNEKLRLRGRIQQAQGAPSLLTRDLVASSRSPTASATRTRDELTAVRPDRLSERR